MSTTVTGAPYVVTIESSGGISTSDVIGVFAAAGSIGAVVVALYLANRSTAAASKAAYLELRRECALRISAWLGDVMLAADTHVFQNDSRHAGEWNDGAPWDEALASVNRGFYHLRTDIRIVFGDGAGLLTAFDQAQRALVTARHSLDEWRAEVATVESGQYKQNKVAWLKVVRSDDRKEEMHARAWDRIVAPNSRKMTNARTGLEQELRKATKSA